MRLCKVTDGLRGYDGSNQSKPTREFADAPRPLMLLPLLHTAHNVITTTGSRSRGVLRMMSIYSGSARITTWFAVQFPPANWFGTETSSELDCGNTCFYHHLVRRTSRQS